MALKIATRRSLTDNGASADRIIEWCRVADMFVDHRFQRDLDMRFVKKIVDGYDEALIGLPVVNIRPDGKLSVIDGQHRVVALRELAKQKCLCEVMEVSLEDEARIFVELQRKRRSMKKFDEHRARLFQKDPVSVDIEAIVTEGGYKLATSRFNGSLTCISTLYTVYEKDGADILKDSLDLIRDSWGLEETSARRGEMVGGMSLFLRAHRDEIKRNDFVLKLKNKPASEIIRGASELARFNGSAAQTMVALGLFEFYNKGRGAGRLGAGRIGR